MSLYLLCFYNYNNTFKLVQLGFWSNMNLFLVLDYQTDFETRCHGAPGDVSGPLSGKNLSEVVNNIVWVRQLELKVTASITNRIHS